VCAEEEGEPWEVYVDVPCGEYTSDAPFFNGQNLMMTATLRGSRRSCHEHR